MSTLVFKSSEAAANDTEIPGVGVLQADGSNSIPIAQAAAVLHELQEKDDEGNLVVGDVAGRGKPLEGKKLEETAKEFAAGRGFEVVSLTDKKLGAEGTTDLLDGLPSPVEIGRAAFIQTFGEDAAAEEPQAAEPAAAEDEGGKS